MALHAPLSEAMDRPPPKPVERLTQPFRTFAQHRISGGVVLLAAAAIALIWANSGWADLYQRLRDIEIAVGSPRFEIRETVLHWINDGLMVVFFFHVGLEIKRELSAGELASPRKAALPALAAAGGMLVPALLFAVINLGQPSLRGWGIPMATDIAFALGVLALLGDRVPLGLKVFLTALAIVDDLGAVIVIALFYTGQVSWIALAVGGGMIALSLAFNALGVRNAMAYFAVGIVAWIAFLQSGVHATVEGVLMALTIPARTRIDGAAVISRVQKLTDQCRGHKMRSGRGLPTREEQELFDEMSDALEMATSPLAELERALAPAVTFFVLPLFALANAGVTLSAGAWAGLAQPVSLGIIAGLVIGKQLGIFGGAYLAVKLGVSELPENVGWRQIHGVAILGGIGFTMSLFIAMLAFGDSGHLAQAKLAILVASTVAGTIGWSVLRRVQR